MNGLQVGNRIELCKKQVRNERTILFIFPGGKLVGVLLTLSNNYLTSL